MFHTAVPMTLSTIPDVHPEAVLEKLFQRLTDVGADRVFLCPHLPEDLEWTAGCPLPDYKSGSAML